VSERTSHTSVSDSSGPMHSGSGNQYVTINNDQRDRGKRSHRRVADDQLARLRRVLVAPAGMGSARTRLSQTGTVILDGEPGSGRTATASVLLREHHEDKGVFRDLLPGEEGELPLSDPGLVGSGDQLLLDLSAADTKRWTAASADLSALRKAVHEQNAHLVVVMPRDAPLDPDLQPYRVEIHQPSRERVLRRHLRSHGIPSEDYLRPDPTVTQFVDAPRPLREVAAFADLIRRAREAAAPGAGFAQWCAAAFKSRADRRTEVATLVAALGTSSQRALAITAAMLHGAHADVIHHTTQLLLDTVQSPPDELPLLQRKDLAERLKEIDAGTSPQGHVRFREVDQDSAVRAHFWDHMPDLRRHLDAWTARTVSLKAPHVTQELREELVANLAGEYLRTDRAEGLMALAETWGSTAAPRPVGEAAVHALTCGLDHREHARTFRSWIYQTCLSKQINEHYAQVLVRVCADVIAASHPDQAMLRLYYLARRGHESAGALHALGDLVATSRRLRRRLLHRLAHSPLSHADLTIFLHVSHARALTEPHENGRTLVEENSVQTSLTTCWRAVLETLPRATWQPHAEHWLHTATDAGHLREVLLDLFVGAAEQCESRKGAAFAALYASARTAERTTPGGPSPDAHTTDLLLRKISAAQRRSRLTTPPPAAAPRETER
jgi:hypothetical protein